ncbi:DUF1624 domain-containing protein [Labilibacter sediminis]|nr:DUF1624 domain-containing protein [Labilibacter sediminis]
MEVKRLNSLDAFRGFTIAAMILVNYPGSWNYIYSPLLHAPWNGLTPTDLIFPFFLFIVGVSISLAYTKKIKSGDAKSSLYSKILIRTVKIFVIGLLLDYIQHFNINELRIAGVLQRIAIVFLFCSFIFLHTKWKAQTIIFFLILLIYWLSMCYIPIPGNNQISLEPGMNFAAWVDSYLLPGKMYQDTWDPEGIYSTLPAISTSILGMLMGQLLISKKKYKTKIIHLFCIGITLSVAGYLWNLTFPINKNIWTSSFVLVTGGFACLFLGISVYVIDILKYSKYVKTGIVFGTNAITAYVLAAVLSFVFYRLPIGSTSLNQHFTELFVPFAPKLGSLIYSLLYVAVNYLPVNILYKKKVFIKL